MKKSTRSFFLRMLLVCIKISKWSDKKLIVFCVGASPIDNPEIKAALPKNFTKEELKVVRWFFQQLEQQDSRAY